MKTTARLLASMCLIIACGSTAADGAEGTKLLALVVGNSAYAGGELAGPAHDAEDMAKVLSGIGFKVINKNMTNLDRDGMFSAIEHFVTAVDEKTIAVVYYSGHGLEDANQNYLVPVDARLKSYGDIATQLVPLDGILTRLGRREALARLIILDACRDMPIAIKYKSGGERRGLAEIKYMEGVRIIYAASPNSVAIPAGPGERNSVFTASLLRAIRERQGTFDAILVRAAQLTREATGRRQEPWSSGPITTLPLKAAPGVNPLAQQPDVRLAENKPAKPANCVEVSQQVIVNGIASWRKVCQ